MPAPAIPPMPMVASAKRAMASPNWPYAPADGDKGPIVGGRAYQRYRWGAPKAVLASFDLVSRLTGAPTQATDVTAADDVNMGAAHLYGTSRVQITTNSTTALAIKPAAALSTAVDVTGGLIRIWFKPISQLTARTGTFEVRLWSAGTPASLGANYHSFNFASYAGKISQLNANGETRWVSMTVPVSMFGAVGTGATLTGILFATLHIAANTTSAMTVAVGNIELLANGVSKGKFIIGFDDQYAGCVAYAQRSMARYGFRGVLYPSNNLTDTGGAGKLTSAQLKNLHDNNGWHIASQAYTTEASVLASGWTADQRTAEMSALRNFQNALGLSGGAHGSYFSNVGPNTVAAYPMFRQAFKSARAYYFMMASPMDSNYTYSYSIETFPWGDPMRIVAFGAGEFQFGATASCSFTGSISGTTLTVTGQNANMPVTPGTTLTYNSVTCTIQPYGTNSTTGTGRTGTYALDVTPGTVASTTMYPSGWTPTLFGQALYLGYWKPLVDLAISDKKVGFLVFHYGLDSAVIGTTAYQVAFDLLMAYLDSQRANIDVVTVQDLEDP